METAPVREPHFTNVEKRMIDEHEVTIRTVDSAAVVRLKERIAETKFTDELVRSQLDTFTQFLEWPMITDDFGNDHNARTDWRNGLIEKGMRAEYDLLDSGIMRGNNLGAVLAQFEALKVMREQLDRFAVTNGQDPQHFWTIVDAGLQLKGQMEAGYETMEFSQRVRFAERVAELVEAATWGLVKLFEERSSAAAA